MDQEQTPKRVSMVAEVSAPDGTTFGILRNAPPDAARLRGQALVDMKTLVASREPELSKHLITSAGLSAEYAMSDALNHAKSPEVKADLLKILVDENLAEGHRDHAVSMLAYAKSAELPVADVYGEPFVKDQYGKALEEKSYDDAWNIAQTVVREGDRITRQDWPKSEEWKTREQQAFEMHANDVISKDVAPEDMWGWPAMELQNLFDTMRFRSEGFENDNPSELSRKIADKYIQFEIQRDRKGVALRLAVDAHMPDDYIKKLGGEVNPTVMDRVEKWAGKVKDTVNRVKASLKRSN